MKARDYYCIEYIGAKGSRWYSASLFRSVRRAIDYAELIYCNNGAVSYEIVSIDTILFRSCIFK